MERHALEGRAVQPAAGLGAAELDDNKRRAMYREMQRILRDGGGVIMPMYANFVFARSTKVARGEAIAANWELDGWKCIERWWFA